MHPFVNQLENYIESEIRKIFNDNPELQTFDLDDALRQRRQRILEDFQFQVDDTSTPTPTPMSISSSNTCAGFKANGMPCTAKCQATTGFCKRHDPARKSTPPVSPSQASSSSTCIPCEPGEKKKRGRPKGSKNKPKTPPPPLEEIIATMENLVVDEAETPPTNIDLSHMDVDESPHDTQMEEDIKNDILALAPNLFKGDRYPDCTPLTSTTGERMFRNERERADEAPNLFKGNRYLGTADEESEFQVPAGLYRSDSESTDDDGLFD